MNRIDVSVRLKEQMFFVQGTESSATVIYVYQNNIFLTFKKFTAKCNCYSFYNEKCSHWNIINGSMYAQIYVLVRIW